MCVITNPKSEHLSYEDTFRAKERGSLYLAHCLHEQ